MGGQRSAGTGGFGSQAGALHRASDFCGAGSWPRASPKGLEVRDSAPWNDTVAPDYESRHRCCNSVESTRWC